ncbi:Sbal_3080 family lipoprotein [Cupriavidus taiwanensis]|uniref:Sbal_3080 family lipoprotein n=1 Tax=Cupriavidus taiwanensis TaxID=164546 RepID=UPI00253FE8F9|nr:Sbal_3080 family lipoprotein [Cupriavidus taiwanensis]MDK3021582.1 Sbal_3080 family lipoprotein [Cupriavidus taiwanensis]
MNHALLAACAGLLLSACSTYQAVTPVDRLDHTDPAVAFQMPAGGGPLGNYGANGTLLCVVANPVSGNDFVEDFLSSLRRRNFEVKVLQAQTSIAACPMVALYNARGAWYWNAYLNNADITVFLNGDRVGKAIYNANRSAGGLNLSNFVQPSSKLDELVEQLFPGMLPPPPPAGTGAAPAA